LWQNNIQVNLHYIPVHRQPYYEARGFRLGEFPEAERFHQEAISLPMYAAMTNDQQTEVIEVMREILD